MPEIRAALRTRLETRLADLKQPVEPGRLEQELVLQITRTDVDEELDRLSTHIGESRRVLGLLLNDRATFQQWQQQSSATDTSFVWLFRVMGSSQRKLDAARSREIGRASCRE